jgi:hypothetical protein
LTSPKDSLTGREHHFSTVCVTLSNCKTTWYLNSLLQDAVIKIAKLCKVPMDFITNVLGEAQRLKPAVRRI